MESAILKQTKEHSLKIISRKQDYIFAYLSGHVDSVEKWALKIAKDYPNINKKVLLLSVYMHDVGHRLGTHSDHDIKSETEARKFLKNKLPEGEIDKVAHCIRAHRCKDVQPESLEAKILATADSLSHMTDGCYLSMANDGKKNLALEKIERDFRDIGLFPKIKKEVTPLYKASKKLLSVYPDL